MIDFTKDGLYPTDNDKKILGEASKKTGLSEAATTRRFIRLGQMVDHFQQQGYELRFVKDDETLDPFDNGPKLSPMPMPEVVANPDAPNTCNRHFDCDEANRKWLAAHPGEKFVPFNIHCHDDECEDCFGS